MNTLAKLASRKFLVTVATIAALFSTAGETDSLRIGVVGAVAAIYVLAEAILDARGQGTLVPRVVEGIKEGLELGRKTSELAEDRSDDGTVIP